MSSDILPLLDHEGAEFQVGDLVWNSDRGRVFRVTGVNQTADNMLNRIVSVVLEPVGFGDSGRPIPVRRVGSDSGEHRYPDVHLMGDTTDFRDMLGVPVTAGDLVACVVNTTLVVGVVEAAGVVRSLSEGGVTVPKFVLVVRRNGTQRAVSVLTECSAPMDWCLLLSDVGARQGVPTAGRMIPDVGSLVVFVDHRGLVVGLVARHITKRGLAGFVVRPVAGEVNALDVVELFGDLDQWCEIPGLPDTAEVTGTSGVGQ